MLAKRFEDILHKLGMAGLEHPLFYHAPVGIRFEIGGEEPIYLDRSAAKLRTNPAYVQGALDRAAAIYRALPAMPDLLRIDGYPDEEPAESLLTVIQQRMGLPVPDEQLPAIELDEDGDTHAQVQFYWNLSGITFQPEQLLQEIILGDIGGWSGFVSSVYLTGPGPYLYHLYDDRGLDVLGSSRELLLPLYHQFHGWILEYNLEQIDRVFTAEQPQRQKFTIDGRRFSNMAGFYDEVERVFTSGLDWKIGRNLNAFNDILRGGFGRHEYHNEELLYRLFGVNAELLIDHAWGWEPCTITDVKAYKPENKSIVSGQVLQCPYSFDKARLVVREMADALALDLVDKGLVTNQLVLTVGYDIENLVFTQGTAAYTGAVTTDCYGRKIPKHAVGTENFSYTSSANDLLEAVTTLYDRIVDRTLLIRRLSISANRLLREDEAPKQDETEQLDLFTDYVAREEQQAEYEAEHARERKIQKTMLRIKKKFGKNAILKGMNLEDGATARERNQTIGGHQA